MLDGEPTRPGDAEVDALRARVTALEDDLRELAHVATHDLVEPLRMVTSYLGLLERRAGDQLDPTSRQFIAYAVDGAERMRQLLDDLLRFSRAGGQEPARAPVDVGEVVADVLRTLGPAIAEAGATVEVSEPLPVLEADDGQLGQLLQNLIANAVKFHAPGSPNHVVVGARRTPADTGWQLWVTDDGIGIEPRQQERIFEVFQRLHAQEEYPGTGIGLAICRRIAERLGGAVGVASAPGAGSTFTVELPDAAGLPG